MRKPTLIFLFIMLLAGCAAKEDTALVRMSLFKTVNPAPMVTDHSENSEEELKKLKDLVLSTDEIYDQAIIMGKNDTLIAYKVKHLKRFRMKKIEKQLKEKLKRELPDKKITVSSDYKIFLETVRLQEKMKKENLPKGKAEKELKKIIKLSEEKT